MCCKDDSSGPLSVPAVFYTLLLWWGPVPLLLVHSLTDFLFFSIFLRVCACVCARASSDDEHMLIQHYCQSLNQGSPLSQPRSPAQILISMETEEKGELERVLNDLELENRSVSGPIYCYLLFAASFLFLVEPRGFCES